MAHGLGTLLVLIATALYPSALAAQPVEDVTTTVQDPIPPIELGQAPRGIFTSHAWHLEFTGQFLTEAWDFNIFREQIVGATVGLGYSFTQNLALNGELSFLRVMDETGYDVLLPALSGVVRWRAHRAGPMTVFIEAGPGVSYATDEIPKRGTRLNFVWQTGVGATYRLGSKINLVGGLRWLHLSNNSLGGRDKNPDIQAIGLYLGWFVR